MTGKIAWITSGVLCAGYFWAIFFNRPVGDLLSPVIMLGVSGIIFYGYVYRLQNRMFRGFGWLLFLAVFSWAICDIWWGIQSLILHQNPDRNLITAYGYSLTNLFLFLAILSSGYQDFKKMNKIQAMLDTLIVAVCMAVVLWLFVLDQDSGRAARLLSDPVAMSALLMDLLIYGWINVWSFSTRQIRPPFFHRVIVTGGLLYVVIDAIYYYIYFYQNYEANSWIDGIYMISFLVLASSVYYKYQPWAKEYHERVNQRSCFKVGIEILILIAPISVFIFKRDQLQYFILLIVALLIYYILISYTQKASFQERLLALEKKNVEYLEDTIQQRTAEIARLLDRDYITGMYSRRYFDSMLSSTILEVGGHHQIGVIYIDQNKSKAIKHLYGKEVAETLAMTIASDFEKIVLKEQGILASYGDDVFVVMTVGLKALFAAERIAKKMIERCNELFYIENHGIRVTINIGISCYPVDTNQAQDLVKNADIAMMQARKKGYNRIQMYNEKIGNLTYNRHRIELKLKKADFQKEFQLYYQPQVFCEDGTLCGFEALIRWFEGDTRMIPPLDFIPVAEEIGIIVGLGKWIMDTAARQQAYWKTLTGENLRVSVNVSVKQLVEVDFIESLEAILAYHQVDPKFFEIEITESQELEQNMDLQAVLQGIHDMGVSIAIDDFGTGYSSLYYLKNIPADRIKIAKELIDTIQEDRYSMSILQMVISIAETQKIRVIAEGVETKAQWQCLKDLGCHEIQGYYFSRPCPVSEVENIWLTKRH